MSELWFILIVIIEIIVFSIILTIFIIKIHEDLDLFSYLVLIWNILFIIWCVIFIYGFFYVMIGIEITMVRSIIIIVIGIWIPIIFLVLLFEP